MYATKLRTAYQRFISCILVVATVACHCHAQQGGSTSLSTSVYSVDFKDTRTMEIFKAIAQKYKVVIGVSGVLVGPDSETPNISVARGTIKDVLDAIQTQDPRFEWHENSEGHVAVRIKGSTPPLVEVMVRTFDLEDPARLEVAALINGIPEVSGWLKDHSCEMAELFMGRPPTYKWQITMHANN